MSWDKDDVMRWLNDHPLPADFVYGGEKVWPRYKLKKGFGFWLRTSGSYHPALRGLFNVIAEILIEHVAKRWPLPDPDRLAWLLTEDAKKQPELPIFAGEEATQPKPSDNPTGTQTETQRMPNGAPDLSQP